MYALVASERNRGIRENDWVDMKALGFAIPYCDLVLTDKFMAEKARQGKLPKKYRTLVLPATKAGLIEATAWLDSLAPHVPRYR
jgi:hypothetical protein